MFTHNEKRNMPYPAEFIFDIVMDIQQYPKFLPWCKAARIKSDDGKTIIADLIVGTKGLSEKFTSKVSYDKKKFTIITEYIDGPLETMQSQWYITPNKDTSDIDFSVELAFRSGWLQAIFQNLFKSATLRMIEAFEKRAQNIQTEKL